jgi:hypothetical protein
MKLLSDILSDSPTIYTFQIVISKNPMLVIRIFFHHSAPYQYQLIWPNGITEDSKKKEKRSQSQTRTAYGGHINCTISINTYGRFCIMFPQNKMTGERQWLSLLSL